MVDSMALEPTHQWTQPLNRLAAAAERNKHHYKPLPGPNSIRLIDLHPAKEGEALSLALEVISDYRSAGAYHALSYCCGECTDTVPIQTNHSPIFITTNLSAALYRLRSPSETRRLWVDAICINQHDTAERNQQVTIMRQIFATASRVDVWLGPGDETTTIAAALIEATALRWCEAVFGPGQNRDAYVRRLQSEDHAGELEEIPGNPFSFDAASLQPLATLSSISGSGSGRAWSDEHWGLLSRYYGQAWFSRVWVMQEVHSARSVLLHCGDVLTDWEFVALVARLGWHEQRVRTLHPVLSFMGLRRAVALRARVVSRRQVPFLDVLKNAKDFDSTDPRDKVFSLLHHPVRPASSSQRSNVFTGSLSCRSETRGCINHTTFVSCSPSAQTPLNLGIQPDYAKSPSAVFLDVAIRSIQQAGSLEILDYVHPHVLGPTSAEQQRTPRFHLPSWVPIGGNEGPAPMPSFLFDASAGRQLDLHGISPVVLKLGGVRVDCVTHTTSILPIGSREALQRVPMMRNLRTLGSDWLLSLSKVLTLDAWLGGRFVDERTMQRAAGRGDDDDSDYDRDDKAASQGVDSHFAAFAAFVLSAVSSASSAPTAEGETLPPTNASTVGEIFIPLTRSWCDSCRDLIASSVGPGPARPSKWTCRTCDGGLKYDLCDRCYTSSNFFCPFSSINSDGWDEHKHEHELERHEIASVHFFWDRDDDLDWTLRRLTQARSLLAREASEASSTLCGLLREQVWLKSFFTTPTGLIGVGPLGLREGDVIAVLFGARVPVLLRKNEYNSYSVVGTCYVHGMMDGEAVRVSGEGVLAEEVFELC